MFKDRVAIWVAEYVLGGLLIVGPLAVLIARRPDLNTEAGFWSISLFVVALGVILVASGSAMRRRLALARQLEQMLARTGERPQA